MTSVTTPARAHFTCPPIVTASGSSRDAGEALRLRRFVTAVITGEPGEVRVKSRPGDGARLIGLIRERRACPREYAGAEGRLTFEDEEIGVIIVELNRERGRSVLNVLEDSWYAHHARKALKARLAARPDEVPGSVTRSHSPREVSADALPVAEVLQIEPRELSGAIPTLMAEGLLCVRLDSIWRCIDRPARQNELFLELGSPTVHTPVGQGEQLVVPVEFRVCMVGSEQHDCMTELQLLRVEGAALRLAGSLPIGVVIDHSAPDRDEHALTVRGVTERYTWRYLVESPSRVRFLDVEAVRTTYRGRYPDDGPGGSARRAQRLDDTLEQPPVDLPQRMSPDEAFHHARRDLRGLWQLSDDRWRRIAGE